MRRQEWQARQWHDRRVLQTCLLILSDIAQQARCAREAAEVNAAAADARLAQSFGCWRGLMAQTRRDHKAHAFLIKQSGRLCLSRVMCGWRALCRARQTRRLIATNAGSFKDKALVTRSFQAWRAHVLGKLEARCTAARMHDAQRRRSCKRALRSWCELCARVGVGRAAWLAALRQVTGAQQRQLLAAAITAWACARTMAANLRQRIADFMQKARRSQAQAAFCAWRRTAEARVVTSQQHVDATNAWLLRMLTRAFGAWQHEALAAKRRQRHAAAWSDRLKARAMAAGFYAWVHAAAAQRHHHRLLQGAHPPGQCTGASSTASVHLLHEVFCAEEEGL